MNEGVLGLVLVLVDVDVDVDVVVVAVAVVVVVTGDVCIECLWVKTIKMAGVHENSNGI